MEESATKLHQETQQDKKKQQQQQSAPVFIQPLPSHIKVNEAEEVELSVTVQGKRLLVSWFIRFYTSSYRYSFFKSYFLTLFLDWLRFRINIQALRL